MTSFKQTGYSQSSEIPLPWLGDKRLLLCLAVVLSLAYSGVASYASLFTGEELRAASSDEPVTPGSLSPTTQGKCSLPTTSK